MQREGYSHGGELRGDDGNKGLSEGEGSKGYVWVELGGGRWSKKEKVGDLRHQMGINMVAERGHEPRPGSDFGPRWGGGKGGGEASDAEQAPRGRRTAECLQRPCEVK